MERIVMKFGGTSVANPERIARAAKRVDGEVRSRETSRRYRFGNGKNDGRVTYACKGSEPESRRRELDMLLTTGEQVTASLLAMAIAAEGLEAHSYTGWQAGVTTESVHGNARIEHVHADKIVSTTRIPVQLLYYWFSRC